MKNDSIQNFILANEQNLHIADAVSQSWLEVREQIANSFFERLKLKCTEKLQRWAHELEKPYFKKAQTSAYSFSKPAWKKQYFIILYITEYGSKIQIGILRDEKLLVNRPRSDELLNAIKTPFPSASSRQWWETLINMKSPAENWLKPEVLWRMHTDEKFLNEVAEQLLEIAEIAEPIVDRLVQ